MRSALLWLLVNFSGVLSRDRLACPLPADTPSSESTCSDYSACLWENNQCLLRPHEDLAYRIEQTQDSQTYRLTRPSPHTLFGKDIDPLVVEIKYYDQYHFQIQIHEDGNSRYRVPVPLELPEPISYPQDADYEVKIGGSQPGDIFDFRVYRKSTGTLLFDTSSVSGLIFSDQFLQIGTSLPSTYFYGMGENIHKTFRHTFENQTYPIFSRDEYPSEGFQNLYGAHPVYHCIEDDVGNTHAVFFFNSNAMEYSLLDLSDGSPGFLFRSIGGILDIHFFLGPKPEDVIQQYVKMVGLPLMPPYWGLGFQLSRWGYGTIENMKAAVERTRKANIPQDIQYLDIDYFYRKRDFTYDEERFPGLPDYIRELKKNGVKFVTILDPAIVIDYDTYPPYQRGKELDVFVKWPKGKVPEDQPEIAADYMVGNVWPDNRTVFPNFFSEITHEWWANENGRFHESIEFDGLWIDMNEPSAFGTNEWSLQCKDNNLDEPPYPTLNVATGDNPSKTFSSKTICMIGQHQGPSIIDGEQKVFNHYDTHSLYGWSESIATHRANLESTGKRPLVVSRSTFASSGKYTGHWLGDNKARWVDMHRSIIGMFEFNMFGIPYVGADICGFFDTTTEELCSRWMTMGAFYPFSRNHNIEGAEDQDPGLWPNTAEASRKALNARYSLLPYLYTLFYHAHTEGRSVVRPLLNEFPEDVTARDVDDAFLWGSSLYFTPILEEGETSREVYFPSSIWYDYWSKSQFTESAGSKTIDVDITSIPIYIRAGVILPTKKPDMNTGLSRKTPFGLLIALDKHLSARGDLFWDDGETEGSIEAGQYYYATFMLSDMILDVQPVATVDDLEDELIMDEICIIGFPTSPKSIEINGNTIDQYEYDNQVKYLCIYLHENMMRNFKVQFIV